MLRPAAVFACLLAALGTAAAASAHVEARRTVTVLAYPSSTSLRGTGTLPPGGSSAISLAAANGEMEDAIVATSGAGSIAVSAPSSIGPLPVKLFFGHYVSFGDTRVPDALLPWDGSPREAEQPNQPFWLRLTVPSGTPPGTYSGTIGVTADGGTPVPIAVSVRVFGFALPPPGQVQGSLLTAFHVSGQSYVKAVATLNRLPLSEQRHRVNPTLYRFLSTYRISPTEWGYGDPRSPTGYTTSDAWFRSPATNMVEEMGGSAFAAMPVPVSNNRASRSARIAGLDPSRPETWCGYLRSVRDFWQQHGWLSSLPYLFGLDETGQAGFRVVARQAQALHSCFPGAKELITGNPSGANRFLWDGGADDVDIWAVLASRFYGKYTNPAQSRRHLSRAREKYDFIRTVRTRGKQVWTYDYAGTGTPGFRATSPLSDSRMLFLWAALEGIQGVLYGENMTDYAGTDPFRSVDRGGDYVLVYPGLSEPDPSARLEQIRDGIEDWEILNAVRARRGAAEVRRILGGAGLFSANAAGVELGCTIGCELKTKTPFAWPVWSHDASTPRRIEAAKLTALKLLG